MKILKISFTVVLCLFTIAVFAVEKTEVLFVLHDAGETLALKSVILELEKKQISYRVLAFPTAYGILKNKTNVTLVFDKDVDQLFLENEAKVVVTGMASESQLQLSRQYQKIGTSVFGFFDGMFLMEENSIGARFLPYLSRVMVPSVGIGSSVKKLNSKVTVEVVGQPTLEEWKNSVKFIDRGNIALKLELNPMKKTLVYAGAYGEAYEKAFPLFAEAAKELSSEYNVVLSLHPKVSGDFEKEILAQMNANDIIIAPKTIPTIDVAAIADVVSVHQSTVGFQSIFMGKSVVYLDVPESSVDSIAVMRGWAKRSSSSKDFIEIVKKLMNGNQNSKNLFTEAKIPTKSVQRISMLVEQYLKKHEASETCSQLIIGLLN